MKAAAAWSSERRSGAARYLVGRAIIHGLTLALFAVVVWLIVELGLGQWWPCFMHSDLHFDCPGE